MLAEEVMILSESVEKVVWELNELLAAQQRARNFSRATLNGEIDTRSNQFVPQSWDVLPGSSQVDEDASSESEAQEVKADEPATADYEDSSAEEELQTPEALAEEAYNKGFAEGHTAGVQEELARAGDSDRAIDLLSRGSMHFRFGLSSSTCRWKWLRLPWACSLPTRPICVTSLHKHFGPKATSIPRSLCPLRCLKRYICCYKKKTIILSMMGVNFRLKLTPALMI